MIFAEEAISRSPVEIEISKLREPRAVASYHRHQAQGIGNEVIGSQGREWIDQFGRCAANVLLNLLGIEPLLQSFRLIRPCE